MSRSALFTKLRRILRETYREETLAARPVAGRPLSRREFLESSAQTLLAAPLFLAPATFGLLSACATPGLRRDEDTVAIVGAGAAGLTTAYQLRKAGVPFVLYEAASRTGGRIHTDRKAFAAQGQFCELGGELVNSGHESLRKLAAELGVALEDFEGEDHGLNGEFFFWKGQRYGDKDLRRASRPLVRRVASDLRKVYGPAELEVVTVDSPFRQAAAAFDRISLAEYLATASDVEEWFRHLIEIAYVAENGLDAGDQSVLTFFLVFPSESTGDFRTYGESDEISRVRGGSSVLLDALLKAAGGEAVLRLDHRLVGVRESGASLELAFDVGGKTREIRHPRAVLTTPFAILRDIDGFAAHSRRPLELDPIKRKAIRELSYGRNSKIMLGYDRRTWRKPAQGRGHVGAAITDTAVAVLWETSRLQKGAAGILTDYSGGKSALKAAPDLVPAKVAALDAIFPGSRAAANGKAVVSNWSKNSLVRGSYCSPGLNQYTELFGRNHRSELGGRLLFAGEHTSIDNFGYMEGAFESGIRVAEEVVAAHGAKKTKVG